MEDFSGLVSHPQFQTVLLLLATGLLILALLYRQLGGPSGNVVLLLGASGSGKTTLFHQLRDGTTHLGTVPSMQANQDTVVLKAEKGNTGGSRKAFELVDVPGHPKVRGTATQFFGRARKIVFLVDAVEFMGQKSDIAEQLYEILSDSVVQKRRVPILIVCNKTDQGVKAHTSDFVRKRLEKEVEGLRGTRTTLGENAGSSLALAKGDAFTFAGLKAPPVNITSGSALTSDLGEVFSFLR